MRLLNSRRVSSALRFTTELPSDAMRPRSMLAHILAGLDLEAASPHWWAVIFGANLGGNLTPIGSASTLVAVTIIHRNKLPLSFLGFVRKAVPFAVIQLALAVVYLLLFF